MSEQLSCQVVQDLMPLVLDDVCNQDSKRIVEDHIAICMECTQVFSDMKEESVKRIPDEKVDSGFRKAMKKGARRFRMWKILAVCLAAMMLLAFVGVATHPQILYGIDGTVPVSWMQNAHLVRTQQGAILMQFNPTAGYHHFFGGRSLNGAPDENENTYEYRLTFSYPWLAKLLNRDFNDPAFQKEYLYTDEAVIRLANGDWAVAMPFGFGAEWIYQEGRIGFLQSSGVTNEDIQKLIEAFAPVDSTTQVVKIVDLWPEDAVLKLSGTDGEAVVYRSGDEIPLCDQETQEKFDHLIQLKPYFFIGPGEVIYDTKG